jgi:hypothetical protein
VISIVFRFDRSLNKDGMRRLNLVIGGALVVIAAAQPSAQQMPAAGRTLAPKLLSGPRAGLISTIRGNALDSTNGKLVKTVVRLRDARLGRIVGTQVTDAAGMFEFQEVEPGSYIVEIMGNDDTVLAASQLINVNAAEAATAVVKLAFRIPPFAGILGNSTASAIAVIAQAAAAGVLVTTVSGQPATPGPQ